MLVALAIFVALIVVALFSLAHAYYDLVQEMEGIRKAARETAICALNLQTRIHYLEAKTTDENLSQLPQYRRVASN